MRGNPLLGGQGMTQRRSIPAYAGEPTGYRKGRSSYRVYPRVCGGTPERGYLHCGRCGLSPRMRGNPAVVAGVSLIAGSIPAYAGEPEVG